MGMFEGLLGAALQGAGALWAGWVALGLAFKLLIGKRWQRAKHRPAESERFTLDQLQTTQLWTAGFGHFLAVDGLADISLDMQRGLTASWPYPAHWVDGGEEGGGAAAAGPLNLAGLAGLLDIVSTLEICFSDRTHRPGVSVELSLRLTPEGRAARVSAGDRLMLKCSAAKLGATLGFSELAVLDSAGEQVLAVGSHVKFLPPAGGPVWQALMHPWVLPLFYGCCFPVWRSWMDKRLQTVHGAWLALPPPAAGALVRLEPPTGLTGLHAAVGSRPPLLQGAEAGGSDGSWSAVRLGPQHSNPNGYLHGGAIALAAAASGAKDLGGRGERDTLQSLSVQFLSAVSIPTAPRTGKQLLLCSTAGGAAVRAFSGDRCVATIGLEWC